LFFQASVQEYFTVEDKKHLENASQN